jgi:hypothetical protein
VHFAVRNVDLLGDSGDAQSVQAIGNDFFLDRSVGTQINGGGRDALGHRRDNPAKAPPA